MSRYPDQANNDLLERIPLSAGVVLDVGCNTGALGAAYRRLNPRARLLGIDNDPVAAGQAARRLDQVAVVDVEHDPMPFALDRPIDCIVYGDVLEHLRDPWAVLRRHAEVLSDDGTMLICVPNMGHWSFADRLLRGTWKYEPAGLLDETHLRWFSLETMREGLEAAGLVPHEVSPRVFDAASAQEFAGKIAPALTSLGVDPAAYAQRAAPLQYIWRVLKAPRSVIVVAANMLQPVGGVSHVRVVYPMQAIRSDPTVLTQFAAGGEITVPGGDTPRVFVLHRPTAFRRSGRQRVRRLLDRGYLVVTEFDDHPSFGGARADVDQMFTFRGVHAVQTSTMPLAEALLARNPEVAVFPNGVYELPAVNNFADPEQMTFFFGALNRQADWAP